MFLVGSWLYYKIQQKYSWYKTSWAEQKMKKYHDRLLQASSKSLKRLSLAGAVYLHVCVGF